jgi:hypothetical protein
LIPYPIEGPLLKDLVSKNHFNLPSYQHTSAKFQFPVPCAAQSQLMEIGR